MKTNVSGSKKFSRSLLFFSVLLMAVLVSVWARAEQVILAWDANTETDLGGYKIHYGTARGSYSTSVDVHNVTTYTVTGLSAGQTYFFAASAYNSSGNESGYSNEVSHSIPAAIGAPSKPSSPSGAFTIYSPVPVVVDSDKGGFSDSQDALPNDPQEWADTDGGGFSDSQDVLPNDPQEWADTDGGGSSDSQDALPNDPQERPDTNGDGISDNADVAAAAEKQVVEAPILVSPVDDEVVSGMAVLKTGAFRAPVAGTTHIKTRWQVFRDEDGACVLDLQSPTALTGLTVPKLVLDEGTSYFWRAQFIDSNGTASDWSDYEDFATATTDADLDANGIPDIQAVASEVDLDQNGVKDNQQITIKSVKMEGTPVQIGVSIKDCPTALAVESVESEDPRYSDAYAADKPLRMPFGLINFKIAVLKPGDQAAVKLYFSEPAPAKSRWYKYDPIANSWSDFSAYASFAADRGSLTLTLCDGGPGDADGVANGVILDPAGIVEEADAVTTRSDGGAGGGGGGCFIAAANAGVSDGNDRWDWWLMLGLMSLTWPLLCQRQKVSGIWGGRSR